MADQSVVTLAVAAMATPLLAVSAVIMVLAGGGANASPVSAVCGGGGTGQTLGGVPLDAEQIGNAQTIVSEVATRHLPVYAADVAVTTAYTESTLHNSAVQTDNDSEGLFQQRISIYTAAVADDPVKATNAFLDRLVAVQGWQADPVGTDAQAVQRSKYPERYQPNTTLGARLVGQFWPTLGAMAANRPPGGGPAVCAGTGSIVGSGGNTVAGTTTIPTDLVITGSARARAAIEFALAQLGKPYVFGAAGPGAWDCSGLTMGAWAAAGVALPHLAAAQAALGTPESLDLSQAIGGDLVFSPGSDGTPQAPGHVGMVVGYANRPDGRHHFVEQAPMSGVPVQLTEASAWRGHVVAVRRVDPQPQLSLLPEGDAR